MNGSAISQTNASAGPSILDLVHPTNTVSPRLKRVQIESTVVRVSSGQKIARKIQTSINSVTSPVRSSPKKVRSPKVSKTHHQNAPSSSARADSDEELSEPPEVFNTDSEDEKDIITTAVTRIERRMDQSDDDYNPTSRSRRPSTAGSGKVTRATRTATQSRENSFAFSVSPKVPRVVLDKYKDPDSPEAPKRKRGRPRKIVLESPIEADADSEDGPISSRRKILPLTPPSDTAASPLFSHASSAPPSLTASKRSIEAVESELAIALAELGNARKELELLKIKLISLSQNESSDEALRSARDQVEGLREDVKSLERSRAIDREGWELERGRLLRRIKTLEGP